MASPRKTNSTQTIPDVLIVGAGLGGLALACRLAKQGLRVEIYEKNAFPGGRAAQRKVKGYTIDLGPTFLLMPGEFEELFTYCGKKMSDVLPLDLLTPSYRLHFWDAQHLDVSSNLPEMLNEIKRVARQDVLGFLRFLEHEYSVYENVYKNFIAQSPTSLLDIIFSGKFLSFLHADGFHSMWDHMDSFFTHPKMKLAFSFQSMYLGQSPLLTPATYTIVPYVELAQGVWYPKNGIYSIVTEIEKLANELGVKIHYNQKISEIIIENNVAVGIKLENGQIVRSPTIVSDVDLPATYAKLIPTQTRKKYSDAKLKKLEYTCSAFMLYLGVDKKYAQLLHHNVFFCEDFLKNFHELFEQKVLPTNPSIYVNVPSLTNPKLAPKGKHLLYVLVPVPSNDPKNAQHIDWDSTKNEFAEKIIAQLEKNGLTDLKKHIRMKEILTPNEWETLGGLHHGATFGLSPTFFQSSVFRPQQKSEEFENVYFVGASTHPGGGMPMVLISARTCAEKLLPLFAGKK
jgi:phytoene desaturase